MPIHIDTIDLYKSTEGVGDTSLLIILEPSSMVVLKYGWHDLGDLTSNNTLLLPSK